VSTGISGSGGDGTPISIKLYNIIKILEIKSIEIDVQLNLLLHFRNVYIMYVKNNIMAASEE
jgi:hypothetical protein